MLEKILQTVNKFRGFLISIFIIILLVGLSFRGYKLYKWIYPEKQDTIESSDPKKTIKIDKNKKATQVLPEAKELDKFIEEILKSME